MAGCSQRNKVSETVKSFERCSKFIMQDPRNTERAVLQMSFVVYFAKHQLYRSWKYKVANVSNVFSFYLVSNVAKDKKCTFSSELH